MRRYPHLPALLVLATALLPSSAAVAGLCPTPILTITQIQSSLDGGSSTGASLCDGETVDELDGIVYAVYPGVPGFAFADAAGAWNGIFVFTDALTLPTVGDLVEVDGTVDEFFGVSEIVATAVDVVSSGNAPHAATPVATADVATGAASAESFEGVWVEVSNVEITDSDLGFGEWAIQDGGGGSAARVDDLGPYCYRPVEGAELDTIRGMLHYSFDDFKIEPGSDCDFLTLGCGSSTPTSRTTSEIQGPGFVSPHVGTLVETTGVVTGHFEGNYPGFTFFDGFHVQDPVGDGSPATSDGVFVISDEIPTIGQVVTVAGFVNEFNEFDGTTCLDGCVTTVCATAVTDDGIGSAVPSTTWNPPTDTDGVYYEYHESLEGMLVSLPGPAAVVGPTSFGAIFVVDSAEGVDRVLRGSDSQGKQVGVRHWEALGDIGGSEPDDLIVGSTVDNVGGPLTYSFGDPLIITQAGDAWSTITSAPLPSPIPSWPDVLPSQFSAATFNLENFDDGETTRLTKLVDIVTRMGCPTFLGLQEVDTASTLAGQEDEVLTEILAGLLGQGCPYAAANSHPDVGDHGVAVLWRTDRVLTAGSHSDLQGCSAVGSSSSPAYDDFCDGVPELPLFSRRPIVLAVELDADCGDLEPLQLVVIVNHFKSQLGGAPADQRRLEQAELIAAAVDTMISGGVDHVLVLGDLNDFEDSPTLAALTTSGNLQNLWDAVPADDVYSYIFSGVSQALDHQLASPLLALELADAGPLHFDADFPPLLYGDDDMVPWALSDHDPVAATFGACAGGTIFRDGFETGDTTAW